MGRCQASDMGAPWCMCGRPPEHKGFGLIWHPGRVRSCVRPLSRPMTAGPDGFRRTGPKHGCGFGKPLQQAGCPVRRFDRLPSPASALLLLGGERSGGLRRPPQAVPFAIMAHRVRAILLARATAASLRGRRSSNPGAHALGWRSYAHGTVTTDRTPQISLARCSRPPSRSTSTRIDAASTLPRP